MPQKHNPLPSQEELKEHFNYDPETGVFSWRKPLSTRIKVGHTCHSPCINGYYRVAYKGTSYKLHRLIWVWMTGEDPQELFIDHINRVKTCNRWDNLRLADYSLNAINQGPRRITKPCDIYCNETDKVIATNVSANRWGESNGYSGSRLTQTAKADRKKHSSRTNRHHHKGVYARYVENSPKTAKRSPECSR
jgi:hypothetical protein